MPAPDARDVHASRHGATLVTHRATAFTFCTPAHRYNELVLNAYGYADRLPGIVEAFFAVAPPRNDACAAEASAFERARCANAIKFGGSAAEAAFEAVRASHAEFNARFGTSVPLLTLDLSADAQEA
eukprot:6640392-Prymnesium_polylepis.1